MTTFAMLTPLLRSLFGLCAILLVLMNISSTVFAAAKKHKGYTVLSLLLLIPSYFLWQITTELSKSAGQGTVAATAAASGSLPWLIWLAVFALIAAASVILLIQNIRYDRTYITPGTVKIYLDGIPCGICCWRDSGRVMFSNSCMNRICTELTGGPLLNGNSFREAITEDILTADGRVWRFTYGDFIYDGETLHDITASDITAEYSRTQSLEKDKANLSVLNRELREYYQSIDEVVRKQEILKAKISIHDEMNRLMLATMAADPDDPGELDRIFMQWEQNALLLNREADNPDGSSDRDRIEKLAEALKVKLVWQDEIPPALSEVQRGLFFSAAHEALINAVKHAGAGTVEVSFEKTGSRIICRFTNDGRRPPERISFSGGLENLAALAKRQRAEISAECADRFTLLIRFPEKTTVRPEKSSV